MKSKKRQRQHGPLTSTKKAKTNDQSHILHNDDVFVGPLQKGNPGHRTSRDSQSHISQSHISQSHISRELSPAVDHNTPVNKDSPQASNRGGNDKKHQKSLHTSKKSSKKSLAGDKNDIVISQEEEISRETNHHKLLMRWEKDVPLGSKALTAPMLYALERIPDKMDAVQGPWIKKAKLVCSEWRHNVDPEVKQLYLGKAKENRKQANKFRSVPAKPPKSVPAKPPTSTATTEYINQTSKETSSCTLHSHMNEAEKLVAPEDSTRQASEKKAMYMQVDPRNRSGLHQSCPAPENVCVEVDKEILELKQMLTCETQSTTSCSRPQMSGDVSQTLSMTLLQNESNIVPHASNQTRGIATQRVRTLSSNSHVSDHHHSSQSWATLNPSQHSGSFQQSLSELQLSHKLKTDNSSNVPVFSNFEPAKSGNSSRELQMSSCKPLVASKPTQYLPSLNMKELPHTPVWKSAACGHKVSSSSLHKSINYEPPSHWTDYSVVNPLSPLHGSSMITSPKATTSCSLVTVNVSPHTLKRSALHKGARLEPQTARSSVITQRPRLGNDNTSTSGRSFRMTLPSEPNSPRNRTGCVTMKKSKLPTKQGLSSRLSPQLPLASPSFVIPRLPLDSELQGRNIPRSRELPHLGNQPTFSLNQLTSTSEGSKSLQYVSSTPLRGSMPYSSLFDTRPARNTGSNSMHGKSSLSSGRQMGTSTFQDKQSSTSVHEHSSTVSSQGRSRSVSVSPLSSRNKKTRSRTVSSVSHRSNHSDTSSVIEPTVSNDTISTVSEDNQFLNSQTSIDTSKTDVPVSSSATLTSSGLSSFYCSTQYKVSILKKIHEFNQIKSESKRIDSSSSLDDRPAPSTVRDCSSPVPLVVQPAVLFSRNQEFAMATSPSFDSTNEDGLSTKQALRMSANSPESLNPPPLNTMHSVKPSLMVNAAYVGDFSSMSLWEMEQLYAYNKAALHRQKQLTKVIREQLSKMQQEEKVSQDRKLSQSDLYKRFLRFLVEPKCVLDCELSTPGIRRPTDIIEGGTYDKPRLKKEYDTYASA